MRIILFIACLSLFVSSCKTDSTADNATTKTVKPVKTVKKYTLSPFTPSPEYKDAKITSMAYKGGKFKFGVSGKNYKLGAQTPDAPQKMCANSAKGQHIHLIVDNAPYAAKYTADFEHEVADGEHYLLAFLSRSYHESIKAAGAATVQKVNVKNKGITKAEDVKTPMLFYSRPKGSYVGKANTDKVMLDFYMANAKMGAYKVKAEINGEEHLLNKWQPYYIEGLPMGENTIKLTLLDKAGKVADVPLNPVSRTFTLAADPVEKK